MFARASKAIAGIFLVILAGALTWGLSYLLQYFTCLLWATEETFTLTGRASNRLAIETVIAVVVMAILILFATYEDERVTALATVILIAILVNYWDQVARYAFAGTTVVALPAQIVYIIATAAWGGVVWYIFLADDDPSDTPQPTSPT